MSMYSDKLEEDALLRLVGRAMEFEDALKYANKKVDRLESLQKKIGYEDKEGINTLRVSLAAASQVLSVMLIKALDECEYVDINDLLNAIDE